MTSRNMMIAVLIGVLVVTVGLLVLATRGGKHQRVVAAQSAPQAKADAVLPGVDIQGAQVEQRDPAGKLQWRVRAGGKMGFDKVKQVVTGQQVQFEVVQQDKPTVTLRAPKFEADYHNRKLAFTEGINGDLGNNQGHFAVNQISYDLATGKLVGTGGAKFVQGPYTAEAQQIVVDTHTRKVRLSGGVRFARP
jgi:hypothetical protein